MIDRKLLILILCCSLCQTYWTCVSDDKGSLLDAPMGLSQDDELKVDLYIEDCVIDGMTEVAGGYPGVFRNVTELTVECFVANIKDKTVKPKVQLFISPDENMDITEDYPGESMAFTIGPRERKKISLSGIIIGEGPPAGKNYAALYIDPHNEDTDYGDENLINNWSDAVEIWIED